MTAGEYLRLARRESRRALGRIALFVMCVAVGVAAVVVVAGLSKGVSEGIRTEGRRLMAGDVAVEGRRPLPAELQAIADRNGVVARADIREFVSVVLVPGREVSQLAEVKVVEGGYPFYGELKLDPPRPLNELATTDAIVVAPEMLAKLDLKVGDALTLGGVRFTIAGTVVEEPDKLGVSFSLGPRIFLSPGGLARTSLVDRGARVEHRALFKLADGATAADAARLERAIEAELPDAEFFQTRTFTSAQASLRRSFDRIGRYLGLVGLLSLLVGGVGVAQVARAWIAGRTDDVAILRCLGATPREVVVLFAIQVAATALLASVIGGTLGTGLLFALPRLVSDSLLPTSLIRPWQPGAIARGVALGVGVALVFTLPPLLALRRVPPSRVLRRDAEPVGGGRVENVAGVALILASVWAVAWLQTESWQQGGYFVVGLVGATLALMLAAWLIVRAVRWLPRDAGGLRVRHGLARLARPGAGTLAAIVALGLGVTFVFATRVVEQRLGEQLSAEAPKDAPTAFFLDVQSDQWATLQAQLAREGAIGIDSRPIVTARFASIDGVPVTELMNRPAPRGETPDAADRQGSGRPRPRWQLTREQRITYGSDLPRGNHVTSGTFPSGTPGGVSVEEGFARSLGMRLGSRMTLDVQGTPVDLVVTSLRTIDWRTFGINFFLFAESGGPLDEAPQQRVAVARLPDAGAAGIQSRVVGAFPNITVIPIKDVMEKVLAVLDKLGIAVRSLGGFIVVAGTVVLGGTIAASQARRAREVALMKTIGMTARDVVAIFAIEYALVGLAAAIVGVAAGAAIAWTIVSRAMELPWAIGWADVAVAVAATIAIAIVAGLSASVRALRARPVEVLRTT